MTKHQSCNTLILYILYATGTSFTVMHPSCIYSENRLMGNGLLTISDSEKWKQKKQLYDPAFKKRLASHSAINFLIISTIFSYLNTLLIPINEVASKLIEQLTPLADGVTKVPMKPRFGDFTTDVISKVHDNCS